MEYEENGALTTRVATLEKIVHVHERSLYGGFNAETGERQIGLFEQISDVVRELKKISLTLNKSYTYVENFLQGLVYWSLRIAIMGVGGFCTVTWFVVTHWEAINHFFTR